jgi:uncharacterized membrane protein YdjX (TVP38/TMEM64 family)
VHPQHFFKAELMWNTVQPKKTLTVIIAVLVLVSLAAILYPFISNPTSITAAYESAGIFAPIVFIVLVMIAPTPGAIVGASGGAYFGIWEGAVYLFIGNLLGVCITFLLVKKFGRPAAERFFKREKLLEYEEFVTKHGYLPWIVYAIPVFPIELMTFVIGLSKKTFKQFFIIVVTALPFYAILVTTIGYYLSDQFQQVFEYASIAILVVMVYAILHFLYTWKKEEIHATGRKIHDHMSEQVDNLSEQVDQLAKATKRTFRKKR